MSKGPLWSDYKPPSNSWLKLSMLPHIRIKKALIEYAFAIGRMRRMDERTVGDILRLVDGEIGIGELLENKDLGKMLHLRSFILQYGMKNRMCVRTVKRWDRRLIATLPKKRE